MVRECISIEVLENDSFLTLIAIEPFVLLLYVGVRVSSSNSVGFAGSWDTIVPLSSNIGMLERRLSK